MTKRKSGKVAEHEKQVQIALVGLRDGTYMNVDKAVAALGVSKTRILSTSEFTPPLGPDWTKRFLRRHPHLKTKKSKAIETACIKEVTSEQVYNFNTELHRIIREHNIRLENIFNVNETGMLHYILLIIGASIGTANGTQVVVDSSISTAYEAQPGRQEWVTTIECISATGAKIPPMIIFKGTNLLMTWLSQPLPLGWMFSCNESGWTSNYHGKGWIEYFEVRTQGNLQSPDEYRLIIYDGHDSHISASMVNFCIQHRIDLLLLPPHSSHLIQPLDVAVFGPLK